MSKITLILLVMSGMLLGMAINATSRPAHAQLSPANPNDLSGIRLALEDMARSQKKMAECKK